MKNSKTLKNVIDVLTAFIYFCGITTVLALLVHLLSRMGFLKDLVQSGRLSFDVNGIQLFPKTPQPLWQLLFPLVSSAIYIYLLLTIRSFLQNLYQEKIFSHSNIDLCNRDWSCPFCLAQSKLVAMLIFFPSPSDWPLTRDFSSLSQLSGCLEKFWKEG